MTFFTFTSFLDSLCKPLTWSEKLHSTISHNLFSMCVVSHLLLLIGSFKMLLKPWISKAQSVPRMTDDERFWAHL